jgi:hypothetical protein
MAACRFANVLLGAAVASVQGLGPDVRSSPLGLGGASWAHAAAIACYVFALTLLSTYEDEDAPPPALALGFGGALGAVAVWGALLPSPLAWLALAPLILIIATRMGAALRLGTRATGRVTTRWLIRGILLLDAGALLGTFRAPWALVVLALAVPYLGGARLLMGPPKR